jgi:FMN-dependent NADH-azoreductase
MPLRHLLHLDSSARLEHSESRQLTARFVTAWQQVQPQSRVTYRDIGRMSLPHLDEVWVAAYEAEPSARTVAMQQALKLSDQLIDELLAADCYLLGVPMYNLTVPSSLKAYIDQIVRRDRTITFREGGPEGVLGAKKLLVITTRKFSYRPDSGRASRDFLEPYLREIFAILGLTDIAFIHADQLAEPAGSAALAAAKQAIDQLAQSW